MELVYLWVEDYKNIKGQGFNFSPRFTCSYKKDDEKIIIKKNKKIENFFDKKGNINFTAIIGENGCGKSSILECINEIFRIENNKNKNIVADYEHTFDFVLIIAEKDITYEIKSIKNRYNNTLKEKINLLVDDYSYVSNANLTSLNNGIVLDNNTISKKLIFESSKKKNFKLSSFMYLPNKITIKKCDFNKKFEKLISDEKLHPMYGNEPDWYYVRETGERINTASEFFYKIPDEYYRFLLIISTQRTGDYQTDKKEILSQFTDIISEKDFKKYFLDNKIISEGKKISIEQLSRKEKEIYIDKYSDFFEFDFIDEKNRSFNDLSHGEKVLFGQLLSIYYYTYTSQAKSLLFLFDEPEISLHPRWQANYIQELHSLFLKLDKKVQFIFTSHSPFLISDIPKQNILFLNRGLNGECVVVDGLKDKKETFGANIHTLLSDGFFMDNHSLMGTYSKNKISEIVVFYEDIKKRNEIDTNKFTRKDKKKIKQFKKLKNIIGDDYLAQVIGNHIEDIEKIIYGDKYEDNQLERLISQFGKEKVKLFLDKSSD